MTISGRWRSIPIPASRGEPRHKSLGGIGYTQDNFSASAEGKRFAFLRRQFQDTSFVAEVLQSSGKLGATRPISEDDWVKIPLGWTSDSRSLIFASNPQGNWGVFQQNLQTRETQPLFTGFDSYEKSVISSDGQWLLFTQTAVDDPTKVRLA